MIVPDVYKRQLFVYNPNILNSFFEVFLKESAKALKDNDVVEPVSYTHLLRVSVCGTGTLKIKFSGFSWEYVYTHYYLIPKKIR